LVDTEEIITLLYENFKLSLRIKDLDIRLKVRCSFCGKNVHGDHCKEHCIEKEQWINIDYNSELDNFLYEFLMSNRVLFDKFEVQCGDLVEKTYECEKMLVEVEMMRHTIMVQADNLKNKSNKIEEKQRVRRVDLYLTMETQSMVMKENIHLQKETHSSLRWEVTICRSLLVGA